MSITQKTFGLTGSGVVFKNAQSPAYIYFDSIGHFLQHAGLFMNYPALALIDNLCSSPQNR
ncbi:hypothetical protein J3D54_001771 [Pseudomonas sp. GGS8]|nr:hypothetical protein [Pseudomonas sp. GGS8]